MFPGSVAGLPEEMPTMPQLLRKAGYSAHMVSSFITSIVVITLKGPFIYYVIEGGHTIRVQNPGIAQIGFPQYIIIMTIHLGKGWHKFE